MAKAKTKSRPRRFSIRWFKEKARHPDVAPWVVFGILFILALGLEIGSSLYIYFPWFFSTAGWLFVTLSIFVIWAGQAFLITADHAKPEDKLQTTGLYMYTRNPMYLGFVVFFIGLGVGAGSGWFLVTGLIAGPVLSAWVIPVEEAHLAKRYGERFAKYCNRTPRWL